MKMNEQELILPLKRILLAIDASEESASIVNVGATLAAQLGAELHGIYVEDLNLVRLASLPFIRELTGDTAQDLGLSDLRMERILRAQAMAAHKYLLNAAQHFHISSTFKVIRGHLDRVLLETCVDCDLIVLSRMQHALVSSTSTMSLSLRIVQQGARPVYIVPPHEILSSKTIAILYDGSSSAKRSLALAKALSREGQRLVILNSTSEPDARIKTLIAEAGIKDVSLQFIRLTSVSPQQLSRLSYSYMIDLFILSASQLKAHNQDIDVLLSQLRCPTLLLD